MKLGQYISLTTERKTRPATLLMTNNIQILNLEAHWIIKFIPVHISRIFFKFCFNFFLFESIIVVWSKQNKGRLYVKILNYF